MELTIENLKKAKAIFNKINKFYDFNRGYKLGDIIDVRNEEIKIDYDKINSKKNYYFHGVPISSFLNVNFCSYMYGMEYDDEMAIISYMGNYYYCKAPKDFIEFYHSNSNKDKFLKVNLMRIENLSKYVEFLFEFNKCISCQKNVISSNLLHMYNPDERIRIIEIDKNMEKKNMVVKFETQLDNGSVDCKFAISNYKYTKIIDKEENILRFSDGKLVQLIKETDRDLTMINKLLLLNSF